MKVNLIFALFFLVLGSTCMPGTGKDKATEFAMDDTSAFFTASGTEPFWRLTLASDQFEMISMEDTIRTPAVTPDQAMDANVKRYAIHTERVEMQVQISQRECTNALSGEKSPYSVRIGVRLTSEVEMRFLEGCGQYITDYRLHDRWVLESIRGEALVHDSATGERPYLEIDTKEGRFTGFTGCNRMSGTIFYEPGRLRFGPAAVTRRACLGDGGTEQAFLKALNSGTGYAIENNRLTIRNPDAALLVFRKTD